MKQETKDLLKKGGDILKGNAKVFTASTGPLAIALLYPKETITFLTSLREAGFQLPSLAVVAIGMYFFRTDVVRIVNGSLAGVTSAIKEISQKFEHHLIENNKRFEFFAKNQEENNSKFNNLSQKVLLIEERMQVLVPVPDRVKELTEEIRSGLQSKTTDNKPNKGFL